jgi:hypothetical protein
MTANLAVALTTPADTSPTRAVARVLPADRDAELDAADDEALGGIPGDEL